MNLFVGVWTAKLAARELFRPRRYAAPEVLMGKGGSEKSDIFSFGVSVLEVYQGRAPSRASGFKVQADASIETLLCGDANTHSGCLCEDPQHRPTAYQVREHMRVQ